RMALIVSAPCARKSSQSADITALATSSRERPRIGRVTTWRSVTDLSVCFTGLLQIKTPASEACGRKNRNYRNGYPSFERVSSDIFKLQSRIFEAIRCASQETHRMEQIC